VSCERSVVVTGGAGALGRALVRAFLATGDRIAVPWLSEASRSALAEAEQAALAAGRLVLVEADVAEAEGASRLAEAAGSVDVLVNGVGGFGGGEPVEKSDLALWDHMYRLNLRTAVAASRALIPGMRAKGRGAIVNVSSQAAATRPAGLAAYAASKAAVVVLTETLQKELARHDIRVNAVAPGTIDTPANRRAMPGADVSTWTPPERIADVVVWLASDAAWAVRGAVLPV
jgi:NAD(P)-dependent dehydrogenase (short-subunit alcohol dehydrogenase family)